MPKLNYSYVVGLDWLTVYCRQHRQLCTMEINQFSCTDEIFPTLNYSRKLSVKIAHGSKYLPFAEILHEVKGSIMPPRSVHLRILNEWLYTSTWYKSMRELIWSLGLEYVSISRIDVYADFNKFYAGRTPLRLIQDYLSGKVLKIGINRGYLSFDNMGYVISNGARKLPDGFHVNKPAINGITWGRKGYIQTQLYNKSKELRDVKFKPWIYETWQQYGLDVNNVWRLEFRIQKEGKSLQLLDSGDLFQLGISDMSDFHRIHDLFTAYVIKYARFVLRDYHVKKQQMDNIRLFGDITENQAVIRPKINQEHIASNRTAKIVRNFLDQLEDSYNKGLLNSQDPDFIWKLKSVITELHVKFPDFLFNHAAKRYDIITAISDNELLSKWSKDLDAGPHLFGD